MQIIEAAALVFDGREAATVTFEEIAEAAGVSRALVYNYFGDRAGLLAAIHGHAIDRLMLRVAAALASATDRHEAVARVVAEHLRLATEDRLTYRYATDLLSVVPPELRAQRIQELAELFGGSEEAQLVAAGLWGALPAMVAHEVDRVHVDPERAAQVITEFLWSGVSAAGSLGLPIGVTWTHGG